MRSGYTQLYSRRLATSLLLVSLVTLLAAGLQNVADGFADVKLGGSPWFHWGGAIAVELGVAAVALTVAVRARRGERDLPLYAGLVLFVGVSVFANYDASLESLTDGTMQWNVVRKLDPWTLLKAGLLGGAIPLMVLLVVESLCLLSLEQHVQRPDRSAHDRHGASAAGDDAVRYQERRNGKRSSAPEGDAASMSQLIESNPDLSAAEVARVLNVSRATVYRWSDKIGARRDNGKWAID